MNRSGRSLNRLYPDDYGRTCKDRDTHGWIPDSRHHTRGRSFRQLSPWEAGKGYKIEDGNVSSSYWSRDFYEGEDRKSYQDYLKKHDTSNYDNTIGCKETSNKRYKDRGQDIGRTEWSRETNCIVNEKKASRERERLFKYEKWMNDKGWIRTYEGDWERSRIERNGFRWENAKYYEKYREWENEDNDWMETNRGRSRYRTSKIDSRSYEYMPGSKENWYRYKEQDPFISGGQRYRYSKPNNFYSKVSSDTEYLQNERDRSPVKRFSRQKQRSNSFEHSSSKRVFTQNDNCSTSEEGKESAGHFEECHSVAVKSETNSTRKTGDTSSIESGEVKESSPRSTPRRASQSSPRLKSQIGLIPNERLRRPRESSGIQYPCDFYQKGICKFSTWHNDRSGCCRLHVCAFCFYQDYYLIKRGTPVLNLHMEKNCPRLIAKVNMNRSKLRTKSLDRCHRNKIREYGSKKGRDNSPGVIKSRCKSLDRRVGKHGESNKSKLDIEMSNSLKKDQDNSPGVLKSRCKSLDRRFGKQRDSSKSKLDIEMSNSLKKDQDNSPGVLKSGYKSLDMRFGKHRESNKSKLDIEMSNIEITVYNRWSKDEHAENYTNPQSKEVSTENPKKKIEESTDSESDGSDSLSDTDDESEESSDDSRKSSEESDATTSESHDSDQQDRIQLLKTVIKDLSKINDGSKTKNVSQKCKKEKAKVLVSGLNPNVSQDDIYKLFSTIGRLEEAKLIGNGKAEVVFTKSSRALLAVKKFDNKCLDGKLINCSLKAQSPVYKEVDPQPEDSHNMKKGNESSSKVIPFIDEDGLLEKDQKNNMKETENEEALNVQDEDVKSSNKVHEEAIDLNISQDLFKSAPFRDLALEENMQESD